METTGRADKRRFLVLQINQDVVDDAERKRCGWLQQLCRCGALLERDAMHARY